MAKVVDVEVFDMSEHDADGLAGAIAVRIDRDKRLRAAIWLAEDLDEDLRADVLAFGIAVFAGAPERLTSRADGRLGIGRERLPSARGVGHLAWHMLYTCGRDTPSATFDLVSI